MYKNQLRELALRSCFNLSSYTSEKDEGPHHAPRFKAAVNFNGETFESPSYCSMLHQAEHCVAEMALNALSGLEFARSKNFGEQAKKNKLNNVLVKKVVKLKAKKKVTTTKVSKEKNKRKGRVVDNMDEVPVEQGHVSHNDFWRC